MQIGITELERIELMSRLVGIEKLTVASFADIPVPPPDGLIVVLRDETNNGAICAYTSDADGLHYQPALPAIDC